MAPTPRSIRSVVVGLVLTAALAACTSAPPSPPPAEPHTGFAPYELHLPGGPDWLGSTAGSLWVKRDDGFVTRIDPTTGEVLADIDAQQVATEDSCNGLGVSDDAVWTCADQSVVRIDPGSDTVTDTIPAGKIKGQGRLVEAAGRIWVLTGQGDQLVGIRTADRFVGDPITLPVACKDLASAGDILYAVCTDGDTVLRIDPATADIASASVPTPDQVSATPSAVWVAGAEGVLRLDPMSLATQLTVPGVLPGWGGAILADDRGVWVRQADPFLVRIDATSGAQTRVISAPFGTGDVIAQGDRLWTSDWDGGVVLRLTMPASS